VTEQVEASGKPVRWKSPAIGLAISAGAVVAGSAVCTPGCCGCTSWAGLPDPGAAGDVFLLLAVLGVIGIAFNVGWLAISVVKGIIRHRAHGHLH